MKKKLEIGVLYDPKTLKPTKYVVTPSLGSGVFPEAPLFTGTKEECKEFVKNYKEEKSKNRLTFFQTIKYIGIVKYYEHIFPLFSDKLEKERMQVSAFIVDAWDTKHWSKYQTAKRMLKFGYTEILGKVENLTTVIKDLNTGKTTELPKKEAPEVKPKEPVVPVPEVQATIEALEAEMKNPQPWTGASKPEEAFPLELTDKILKNGK